MWPMRWSVGTDSLPSVAARLLDLVADTFSWVLFDL